MFFKNGYNLDVDRFLFRRCDASLLAFLRISFGFFMMMDVIQERGMFQADQRFGGESVKFCTFPLIQGLKPFKFDVMVVMYAILFCNSFFVAIGYLYRLNILSYTVIYWYFFMLDTSVWNNHSYLFGLIALLLAVSDAHRYMSFDNLIFGSNKKQTVPHWNYLLFRFQVFIVYFYAGIKKTEGDWLKGYSMQKLSREWVFDPFRPFLSNESIDLWIVHIGGFIFDISVGFMLLFEKTRMIGLMLCASFHGMNLVMFNIGMFPYVMMACSFIFCDPSSFRILLSRIAGCRWYVSVKSESKVCKEDRGKESVEPKCTLTRSLVMCFCFTYVITQSFLPYSHFITKGYNGWVQGLYGYSWDMMVHSFSNQHIKITYKDLDTGDVGFLKPEAFSRSKRLRWTLQPAMAYQYAVCIGEQLKNLGINNSAVYFDVWKSMNRRFQQRIYDPDMDIANYQWSVFEKPKFVLPLLSDLSNWREELKTIKDKWKNFTTSHRVVFVSDFPVIESFVVAESCSFPGLHLDNYVSKDIGSAVIHVLRGKVVVHINETKTDLIAGENLQIPADAFHRVETVSEDSSCYYYVYVNETVKSVKRLTTEYGSWLKSTRNDWSQLYEGAPAPEFTKEVIELYNKEQSKREYSNGLRARIAHLLRKKLSMFQRSYFLFWFSVRNLLFGAPPEQTVAVESALLNGLDSDSTVREITGGPGDGKRIEL